MKVVSLESHLCTSEDESFVTRLGNTTRTHIMSFVLSWILLVLLLVVGDAMDMEGDINSSSTHPISVQLRNLVKDLQLKNLALMEELSWWDTEMIKLEEEILDLRHSNQNLLSASRREHGRREDAEMQL